MPGASPNWPQNVGMNAALLPLVAGVSELSDPELHVLIDTANGVPQFAPGLVAWIVSAAERPLTGGDADRPELGRFQPVEERRSARGLDQVSATETQSTFAPVSRTIFAQRFFSM
jgi:hypothetical protein